MATYLYHDFEEQATDTLRLGRLRQHITEVRANAGADGSINADAYGKSQNRDQYLAGLETRRKELESKVNRATRGVFDYMRRAPSR